MKSQMVFERVVFDRLDEQDQGKADHDDRRHPCDDIKDRAVSIAHHQLLVIDEKQHEDEDDGQHHPVNHLGEVHDRNQGKIGIKDDPRPQKNHEGVEPVELGGLQEFLVNPHLPTQAFADEIGRREGKDGGGKERGVDQTEGKEVGAVLSRQGSEGKGGILGRLDLHPVFEEGLGADQDDEEGDDMDGHGSHDDVESRKLIFLDLDPLLHNGGLKVKLHPGGNRRSHETDDHRHFRRLKAQLGVKEVLDDNCPSPA